MTEILALLMKKCEEQNEIIGRGFDDLPYQQVPTSDNIYWESSGFVGAKIERLACLGLAVMDEQKRMIGCQDASNSRIAKIYSAQLVFNYLRTLHEWVRNRHEQWAIIFPDQNYIQLMSNHLEFKESLELLSQFDDYKNDLEQFKFKELL